MSQYQRIKSLPTRKFVRKIGINLPHVLFLCHKVAHYEAEKRRKWLMKNRYLDILVKVLRLPGRKALLDGNLQTIILDVTEQPIERPTTHQRDYYSGKKKHHTIKAQVIICLCALQILSVICGKGRPHDFTLFKHSKIRFLTEILKYADSGYQGIRKLLANARFRSNGQRTSRSPLSRNSLIAYVPCSSS